MQELGINLDDQDNLSEPKDASSENNIAENEKENKFNSEEDTATNKEEDDVELSEKEERLARDYQLRRALDLIRGLSIFEESLEE